MEQTKVGRILSKLGTAEINWLTKALEKEGKPKRLKLFQLLRQENITRNILFKKLFGTAYKKEKDYLLRNELFKLTEWLQSTLIEKAHLEALQNDKWQKMNLQLQLYIRLRLNEEAESIYNQLQEQLEQANLYSRALSVFFEYVPFIVSGDVHHKSRAARLRPVIEKGLEYFYKSATIQYQNLRTTESFLKHFSKQAGAESADICSYEPVISINLEQHQTNLSDFLNRYAYCFRNVGTAQLKIDDTLAAEKAILPLVNLDPKYKTYYISILHITGIQYSINGDFEKADSYFRRGLEIVPCPADMFQSLIMNHTTNLIKLKKYAEAAELLESNSAFLIQGLPVIATIINQRLIGCYIYLKQADKLYKILNTNFDKLEPYLQLYYRLSYCVLLLIKKEYETAWREITNIHRSKLGSEAEAGYTLIIEFFNETIRQIHHHQTVSRLPESAAQKIKPFAGSVDALQFTNYSHLVPYVWLKEAVGI